MFKLDLEKAEEPEVRLPTSTGSPKKAREFQKNIYFSIIDSAKTFDCVDHHTLQKILKETEYQTTWPASWEICMHDKKQQLEPDLDNRLVSNQERSTSRLYIVTLLI